MKPATAVQTVDHSQVKSPELDAVKNLIISVRKHEEIMSGGDNDGWGDLFDNPNDSLTKRRREA